MTPQQQALFFALINQTGRENHSLTSREERRERRRIRQDLERCGIQQAYDLADTLVDIGIYGDVLPYLELFQHPNNTQILRVAYNLAMHHHHRQTVLTAVDRSNDLQCAVSCPCLRLKRFTVI